MKTPIFIVGSKGSGKTILAKALNLGSIGKVIDFTAFIRQPLDVIIESFRANYIIFEDVPQGTELQPGSDIVDVIIHLSIEHDCQLIFMSNEIIKSSYDSFYFKIDQYPTVS